MSRGPHLRSDPLRTYRDATALLESLVRRPPRTRDERERLGLSPIESLLDRIGNPHRRLAAIHITGSKGKGSTALYTEALLSAAGVRTGTFTSPHLEDWNERIRVAGAPIDRSEFVEALERVRSAIAELHRADADTAPAFFDALVAAAFSVFADARVDIAVVEAGIGARLDPTRACRAVATCVTGVELEHTDRLGSTIADIAREKAAVVRPGVPLVAGCMPEAALAVLEREAAQAGAPLLRLGRDFTIRREVTRADSLAGSDTAEIALAQRAIPVSLRQPGRHMLENSALALALANEVGALSRIGDTAAGTALRAAVLPGRAEVLQEAPLVIADGAHTRASIEALLAILDARSAARLVAVGLGHPRQGCGSRAVTAGAAGGHRHCNHCRSLAIAARGRARARPRCIAPACRDCSSRRAVRRDAHGNPHRRSRRDDLRDRIDVHGRGRTPHSPDRVTGPGSAEQRFSRPSTREYFLAGPVPGDRSSLHSAKAATPYRDVRVGTCVLGRALTPRLR